uniref:Uncharacterized protein n=1 Tax=Picea glauca TaxID=3330 RepID=A0A101M102_PICGL|nr:hypothetical protein ABT39_MTgene4275 [Picea glauca]QHR90543.1 hypothetical protein Q903MT_gene4568 [Picea sitchensis]
MRFYLSAVTGSVGPPCVVSMRELGPPATEGLSVYRQLPNVSRGELGYPGNECLSTMTTGLTRACIEEYS